MEQNRKFDGCCFSKYTQTIHHPNVPKYLRSRVIWSHMKTRRKAYGLTAFLWLAIFGKKFLSSYDWRIYYDFIYMTPTHIGNRMILPVFYMTFILMTSNRMLAKYTSHIAIWLRIKETASALYLCRLDRLVLICLRVLLCLAAGPPATSFSFSSMSVRISLNPHRTWPFHARMRVLLSENKSTLT